jgi:hypothetical protein
MMPIEVVLNVDVNIAAGKDLLKTAAGQRLHHGAGDMNLIGCLHACGRMIDGDGKRARLVDPVRGITRTSLR